LFQADTVAYCTKLPKTIARAFFFVLGVVLRYDTIRYIICTEKLTGKLPV